MDNLTHTLIGLGAGELVQRSLPPEADPAAQRTRHRLLLTACALASNFPDLDLFLTHLLPAPLGYLLHHRGHTHTILYALPQALLLLALLWLLWPNARRLLRGSAVARRGLGLATVLGFGLHLGMDFLNSYGVHPFYPFDARWFYGDMVFIIEPVFWVAFGVPLIMSVPWKTARWGLMACLAAALAFFLHQQFLSPLSFGALLALGAGLAALRRFWAHSRWAMAAALGASVAFIGVQGAASQAAAREVRATLQRLDPQARVLDTAMNAFPAQPLCWTFVSIESDPAADRYRLRRGLVSVAPGVLPPSACTAGMRDPGQPRPAGAGVLLYMAQEGSLSGLRRARAANCWVDHWLRFGRMPLLANGALTDMRFATTPRGNFSTMDLADAARQDCPASVPAWTRPRADLLAAPG